jgi:hypothetical protein
MPAGYYDTIPVRDPSNYLINALDEIMSIVSQVKAAALITTRLETRCSVFLT